MEIDFVYILCVFGVDGSRLMHVGRRGRVQEMDGPLSARETPPSSVSGEMNLPAALERVRMLLNG